MSGKIIDAIQEKFNTDYSVRCLYINNSSDNIIDITAIIDDKPTMFLNQYLDFFLTLSPIIHYELLEEQLFIFYDDSTFLKFQCSNFNKIKQSVKVLINRDNIKIPNNDALTNHELINNLNKLFYNLIEFIDARKTKDSICSFHKTIQVIDTFIVIYRAFFDSYNAKKGYESLKKTMSQKNYDNLESILKKIKFENNLESILIITSIVDQLIKNLPLSILNDIDVGFYNFIKHQLYELS